jgi:hypothetical protein
MGPGPKEWPKCARRYAVGLYLNRNGSDIARGTPRPLGSRHGARQAVMAASYALVGWRRDGDLFEPCVACLHAMCAELCLFSRSLKMQAAVQSAPRDKSLIFRPSADNSSRRRLRLLSCHKAVGPLLLAVHARIFAKLRSHKMRTKLRESGLRSGIVAVDALGP